MDLYGKIMVYLTTCYHILFQAMYPVLIVTWLVMHLLRTVGAHSSVFTFICSYYLIRHLVFFYLYLVCSRLCSLKMFKQSFVTMTCSGKFLTFQEFHIRAIRQSSRVGKLWLQPRL